MVADVVGPLWRAAPLQIGGARADQVTQLDDPVCDHGGALERAHAYRRIKAFPHQIDQAFAEVDLELYRGVGLDEIHRDRRDHLAAERGRRSDLELA